MIFRGDSENKQRKNQFKVLDLHFHEESEKQQGAQHIARLPLAY